MIINEKYKIVNNTTDGCVLIFSEIRQRKNKTTEEIEDYTFIDRWYYPTVYDCLKKYCHIYQGESKDVEDLLKRTEELFTLIKKLK